MSDGLPSRSSGASTDHAHDLTTDPAASSPSAAKTTPPIATLRPGGGRDAFPYARLAHFEGEPPCPICHILLIGGSLRAGSTNAAVLNTARALVPAGATAEVCTELGELPHFNPDDDRDPLPPSAARLRERLRAADAVLISTPEYAGSLPGSFKNLLDWTVGEGLYEKPIGFINASAHGAALGAHATLRVVLGYVNADLVEGACVQIPVRRDAVGADGIIGDPDVRSAIAAVLTALVNHVASKSPHA
jgi:chromate reductase